MVRDFDGLEAILGEPDPGVFDGTVDIDLVMLRLWPDEPIHREDVVTPPPPPAPPPLRPAPPLRPGDDPDVFASLDELDRGLFTPEYGEEAPTRRHRRHRLDWGLDPDPDAPPLADDPTLIASLDDLDRGVFDGGPPTEPVRRHQLSELLIAPDVVRPRPAQRTQQASSIRPVRIFVQKWVAATILITAMFIGAMVAARVFADRIALMVVQWERAAPPVAHALTLR